MSIAFTWLLMKNHDTVRYVVVDTLMFEIVNHYGARTDVEAVECINATVACKAAVTWTENRERRGYELADDVLCARVTVNLGALVASAYEDPWEPGGPFSSLVNLLLRSGQVLS